MPGPRQPFARTHGCVQSLSATSDTQAALPSPDSAAQRSFWRRLGLLLTKLDLRRAWGRGGARSDADKSTLPADVVTQWVCIDELWEELRRALHARRSCRLVKVTWRRVGAGRFGGARTGASTAHGCCGSMVERTASGWTAPPAPARRLRPRFPPHVRARRRRRSRRTGCQVQRPQVPRGQRRSAETEASTILPT